MIDKKIINTITEYTLGHSLLSPNDIASIAEDNHVDHVFVADTMNVSSLIPLSEKLKDKLIFGVRFNLVDELVDDKKAAVFRPKVYPRTPSAMALKPINIFLSFEKPQFYFVPRLSLAQFAAMLHRSKDDDFVITTGDFDSVLKHPNYSSLLREWSGLTPHLYAEKIIGVNNAVFSKINELAHCSGLRCISSRPVLYLKGDEDAFPIHYSINKNVEFNYLNPYNKDLYYHDHIVTSTGAPWDFTHEVSCLSYYKWKKQEPKLPVLAVSPIEKLKEEAIRGFREKLKRSVFGYKPTSEDLKTLYVPRLAYELETIDKLGFASYFLMVWEVCNWAKRNGIAIGAGRGSAAGSLISYCLSITNVDPIRHNLMFERFINPSRLDLPDIDLDFMSSRREEIVEHLYDRYGKENVAGIINYASLQSRSALRSTCRIMKMSEVDYSCSKLIPSEFGFSTPLEEAKDKVADIRHFSERFPFEWEIATKLEKKLRNFSTHAAGIIVSDRPLINDAVIEQRGGSRVINWDKKTCEKQGLIKLDVLGLTTLDIIDGTVKLIKERRGVDVDIEDISLDDSGVLGYFSSGHTAGVFQFEGGSVKRLLRDLSDSVPLVFDDLVAANALNRPGPIEAGLVKQYVDGKNGNLTSIPSEAMRPTVESTYNVICYQEQIMKVLQVLGGFTPEQADAARKNIGKKEPEELKKKREAFVDGCSAGVVLATLDTGSTLYIRKDKRYEVEEGGFYDYINIMEKGLSIIVPLVME